MVFALATADPLGALALDCGKRNEQPVILVKFGIAHPGLQGKLTARAQFEQQISESLAGQLRSQPGLRFLRWSANASDAPRAGVLQVLMTQDGPALGNERAPILLKFQVIVEGRLQGELNLVEAGVLYGAEASQVPGQGGSAWRNTLVRRFTTLAQSQPFANEMIRAFKFVPIVQTEDLLISQASKVIGLPVSPCRLSAGEGTQVDLEFRLRTPEAPRRTQSLWVNPCLLEAKAWQSRLQLAAEQQADQSGQGRSQGWLDFSSEIGNRIPGRTRALLRSFNWKPEEVCGDIEMP